jgi:hypothetical protein
LGYCVTASAGRRIVCPLSNGSRQSLAVSGFQADLRRISPGEDDLEELLPDVRKVTDPRYVRAFREEEGERRAEDYRDRAAKQQIEAP